jgi:hypothetical protein
MSGQKQRGWNDEQRRTLARGGEALKKVGELGFSWLFGTSGEADKAKKEITEGLGEKVEELRQAHRRENSITVAGELVDVDEDLESGDPDGFLNRIECLTCQTMVGAVSRTAIFDARAIRRFAREHEGHDLRRVRPTKEP